MSNSCIKVWGIDSAHENASHTATWNTYSEDEIKFVEDMVWSPHGDEIVATYGSSVAGWDLRSGKTTFEKHRAHPANIRAVDYNHNKPHHIVTGADDATICIWDTRYLSGALMEIVKHTHWVRDVAYNSVHDQLILSSSSDTLVNLHSAVSVSSASYMGEDFDDDDESASSYEAKE
jgi:WD40 repeat protein